MLAIRRAWFLLAALAAGLALAPMTLAQGEVTAQTGPEYGLILSHVALALRSEKRIYTCDQSALSRLSELLAGPAGFERTAKRIVADALGRRGKPWPENTRAFTYMGRRYVPEFIKGDWFYDVVTDKAANLAAEVADLQAIARRQGKNVVIVTRSGASLSPTLRRAVDNSWTARSGRVRIVRCL